MTMNGFLVAFAILGYEECQDGALEKGYEKVESASTRLRSEYGPPLPALMPTVGKNEMRRNRLIIGIGLAFYRFHPPLPLPIEPARTAASFYPSTCRWRR